MILGHSILNFLHFIFKKIFEPIEPSSVNI